MKEKILKIWEAVNGKKTAIGTGLHLAWFILNLVHPVTDKQGMLIGHSLIFNITGVGIGHKVIKWRNPNKK